MNLLAGVDLDGLSMVVNFVCMLSRLRPVWVASILDSSPIRLKPAEAESTYERADHILGGYQ